ARGDDDARRADAQPAARRVVVAVEERRVHAGGASVLEHDAIYPAAGVEPRAGVDGRRQVGEVHGLLGVARAAERALAAAVAAVDVAGDPLAVATEPPPARAEEHALPSDH